MTGSLLVKDAGGVRRILFNRPEKLNALRREDIVKAKAVVEEVGDSMGAVVFGGTGERSFSAGVHVEEFADLTPAEARKLIEELKALLEATRRASIPTVCAINGYCLGGAMELAMVCDVRIAAKHARFGMPEIKVGIPSVLDAALLQQHVGLSKAKEMLLTGDLYDAEEMERHGFLNKVVDGDELEGETEAFLARLTAHSRTAIAAQKRLFETWQNAGLRESVRASVDEFALAFESEETRETVERYAAEMKEERGER